MRVSSWRRSSGILPHSPQIWGARLSCQRRVLHPSWAPLALSSPPFFTMVGSFPSPVHGAGVVAAFRTGGACPFYGMLPCRRRGACAPLLLCQHPFPRWSADGAGTVGPFQGLGAWLSPFQRYGARPSLFWGPDIRPSPWQRSGEAEPSLRGRVR